MTLRALSLAAIAGLIASPATAQSVAGYRYSLRMEGSEHEHLARVRDAGDRARLDLDDEHGSYLLILDEGRRVVAVHAKDHEYGEITDSTLDRVIGRALRMVSNTGLVRFRLEDLDIRTRDMGPGGSVAGRPTRHYRLTQDFTVSVSALGHAGDDIHQVVVTDYWVDPTIRLVRNPVFDLVSSVESALAQQSPDFQRRTSAARSSMFTAVPLRVAVTSFEGDHDHADKSRVIQVGDLAGAAFDPGIFEIPAGFRRRPGESLDFGSRD